MKKLSLMVALAVGLCLLVLTGCHKDSEPDFAVAEEASKQRAADVFQFCEPEDSTLCACFSIGDSITGYSEFAAVLFPDYAPQAVENFVTLSREGAYDNLTFHRVIRDFIIQSGDTDGVGGKSIWRNTFSAECCDKLHHYTGALCMAGGRENGSQFYVVTTGQDSVSQLLCDQMSQLGWDERVIQAYKKVGGAPYLDNNYTVFGQVFYGWSTVCAIADTAPDTGDTPASPMALHSVRITTYGAWKAENPDAKTNFYNS